MAEPWQWHEIFGLTWVDFFRGTTVEVKQEFDTSVQQQKVDIVIIRHAGTVMPRPLPDGFSPLAEHNLISFKSHREALDAWALDELVGHYVAYRKFVSPKPSNLLPRDQFRLIAVAARFPRDLASSVEFIPVGAGLYDVAHFGGMIRVAVIHELPCEQQNAMMHLYSADRALIAYAAAVFRPYSDQTGGILTELLDYYKAEGLNMPITLEEFNKRSRERLLNDPETRQQLLSDPEMRQQFLNDPAVLREVLNRVSPDDLLREMTPEQRAEMLRRLTEGNGSNAGH